MINQEDRVQRAEARVQGGRPQPHRNPPQCPRHQP